MSIKKTEGHSLSKIEGLFADTIYDVFYFDIVFLQDASDEPTNDKFNWNVFLGI